MRILHITPYYPPAYAFGGVPRAVEGMCRALSARGHEVHILTTDAFTRTSRYTGESVTVQDGVHVRRVRNLSVWLRGNANLSTPMGIGQLTANIAADVAHLHEFRTVENLLSAPHLMRGQTPVMLSPHGTLPHGTGRSLLKQGWDKLLSPSIARAIHTVIGLTPIEVEQATMLWDTFGQPLRTAVVPNGVSATDFADMPPRDAALARFGLPADAITVLFVGRLHPRKGVDRLARVFTTLTDPRYRLLIVGPDEGLTGTLNALVADDDRIQLAGYLDGADRLAAFAASDVFALPAVGEGLPMAALEAMAAGLPVLLSPECYLPEVATAGAGAVIPLTDDALAATLTQYLQDDALRQTAGQAARQLVATHYTWEAVVAQLESLYQESLANR
jgi:glycosyltransferase involved in cell wall biosynthesis